MSDLEKMRIGNWKNLNTVERYFNKNPKTREITATKVTEFLEENLSKRKNIEEDCVESKKSKKEAYVNCTFNITCGNNCTINFY